MALLMCPFTLLFAQDQEARLWGKQEAFLKQQATEIFSLVNAILDKDLPSAERPEQRRQDPQADASLGIFLTFSGEAAVCLRGGGKKSLVKGTVPGVR